MSTNMTKLKATSYVTRKAWGEHPAGSSCIAVRAEGGQLLLLFANEDVIEATGCYAAGLEEPPQKKALEWVRDDAFFLAS